MPSHTVKERKKNKGKKKKGSSHNSSHNGQIKTGGGKSAKLKKMMRAKLKK